MKIKELMRAIRRRYTDAWDQTMLRERSDEERKKLDEENRAMRSLALSVAPTVFTYIEWTIVLALLAFAWFHADGWDRALTGVVIVIAVGALWLYFINVLPEAPAQRRGIEFVRSWWTLVRILLSLAIACMLMFVAWRLVIILAAAQYTTS